MKNGRRRRSLIKSDEQIGQQENRTTRNRSLKNFKRVSSILYVSRGAEYTVRGRVDKGRRTIATEESAIEREERKEAAPKIMIAKWRKRVYIKSQQVTWAGRVGSTRSAS